MNKVFIILSFFFVFNTTVVANKVIPIAKTNKITFTEKDIEIDSALVERRTFAKDFKKKYTDSHFIYEYKTPEKNAWDRFKEWLAGIFKNLFSFSDNTASMKFVEVLLKILALILILFVIYLITKSILNKEGQWIFGRNSDKKIIDYNEIEKNLHLIDFEKLIQNTLKSGERRLTIRYYYLWILKKMSDKNLIEWDVEKTNSDYLYEIKNQAQKDDFSYLSYLYNYIWYGEFELDEATFVKAKNAFEKTIKSLGNG